jgi:integrating conjugative element protein (TIGR03758 family)
VATIGAEDESLTVDPVQLAAFQAASGVNATTLLLGIASIILLLAFIWVVWVTLGTFRAWQDGNASLFDVAWSAIRASIILMVLGFYLR